jgi:hypothetical protein
MRRWSMSVNAVDRRVTSEAQLAGEQAQHRLRRALALLWLFDGGLQLQPFMFSDAFVRQVLEPAAAGQPGPVAAVLRVGDQVVGSQLGTWSMVFAGLEIGIGVGLLYRPTVRPALWASCVWSGVVWVFGEGLGSLLTGHASLLNGAPGAALLYLVLTLLAWPGGEERIPRLRLTALLAWIAIWLSGSVLQLQTLGEARGSLANVLLRASAEAPGLLANAQVGLAHTSIAAAPSTELALAGLMAVIAITALHRRTRSASLVAGTVVALVMWPLTQSFGGVFTGTATDPGTAPLVALLGLAVWRFDRLVGREWL